MAEVLPFPVAAVSVELSQPPDAQARLQALDTRSSFIVEAPAGSGKTGLLIQRYLKLLADESVESPEQVLAITFTNKATAELRDRVLAQLEAARLEAAQPANEFDRQTRKFARAVLERDRQLGWSLLDHPGRLHLRTIDSVCMEIARTLPVLSGSGGGLTPSDDAGLLHHEAARRTVLLLGTGDAHFDAALGDLLLHRDGNLAECQSLIAEMLSLRDQWGGLIPLAERELTDEYLDSTVLPRLEAALDHAICAALTLLERSFPPDLLADLTELAADLGRNEGYGGKPSPIALCSGLRNSPGAVSRHLDHWRALIHLLVTPSSNAWRKSFNVNHVGFEQERHQKALLQSIRDQLHHRDDLLAVLCEVRSLPPAEYPPEQWAVAKCLFRVLSRALVELQLVFAEQGQCDFTEFSLRARQALQEDSGADDLAAALGARLQHLLVDEMQDTSTSQYELIERLTASWDGHSQTVLLVGDPRQSIYLFRQARVERFLHALENRRLGDLPLTRLRLTANFRSQTTLVEQFNQDFKLVFPSSTVARTDPTALPYEDAEPTLPPMPDAAGAVWHTHPLPAPDPSRSDAALHCNQVRRDQARLDAAQILDIASSWIARPLPPSRSRPWTIAVLVRSRSHLREIVAAIRQQADPMPFRAIEIEALGERQEILDLTALTRALLHPADRVAALAVLRAPWCGLSLADLHTLTGADDDTLRNHSILRLMGERGHLLPDESCQRMGRIWTVLEAAAGRRTSLTTAQLVERAWLSLGGDTWLSPPQLANAHRFFQLLDELEAPDELLNASSRIDSSLLQSRLSRLYAEPQPIPAGTPFLELLTIHKAKGLEWDVVLVPALEARVGSNRSRLLTWSEIDSPDSQDSSSFPGVAAEQAAHIMLAPIAGRGEPSKVLNSWLNSIHSAREAAETKRLFYVACTRACQELHLFAAPQRNAKGELTPVSGSLLKAAWAAAQPHFDSLSATETQAETVQPFQPAAEFKPAALSLAAAASSADSELASSNDSSCPILERLPLTFNPTARFARELARALPCGDTASAHSPDHARFARPEGSFAARSFGNAVHALLELLSTLIQNGESPRALLAELASWGPRISALLRADGLPRTTVERLTRDARTSLENTLRDPDGLWLLSPHANPSSEFALTASSEIETQIEARSEDEATPAAQLALPSSIRVDRIFEAGPKPHTPGDGFLWIIDYKTTAPGPTGLDDFLNAQRKAYGPQLETYARILTPARGISPEQVRLALYFPTISRLHWWPLELVS